MKVTVETEDGSKQVLTEIKDNWRRLIIIPVKGTDKIKCIRIDQIKTWGEQSPVIYEVCAYAQ